MFSLQAMVLLEWASRLCASNALALADLSRELHRIEPLYFTPMPGVSPVSDPVLPSLPGAIPGSHLLWMLFDLVRNGQAHQYQQIIMPLVDGKTFYIQLGGATEGRAFSNTLPNDARRTGHLQFGRDEDDDLYLKLRPDVLFLDTKNAIEGSGAPLQKPDFRLSHPTHGDRALRGALRLLRCGCTRWTPPP